MNDEGISTELFTEIFVKQFEALGIRYLGIYLPSNAAGLNWKEAYPDPEYRWSTTTLSIKQQDRYAFENGATMFGRTHIKDKETREYLNLNGLDTDCQIVHNRLSIPIGQILDDSSWDWVTDRLKDLVKAFLSSARVLNGDYNQSLLDVLKKSTFVTKTRKVYGHHIYWLSRQQKRAIGSADCRKGYEFELKTDNKLGLCTLPPSRHKDDINFRYKSAGITDHLLVNDIIYDLFAEMFNDCLANATLDDDNTTSNKKKEKEAVNRDKKSGNDTDRVIKPDNFITLSNSTIRATAGQMSQFVAKGYRNDFYVKFSGMMFHARISDESGAKIIARMCMITGDKESKSRQTTFMYTYNNGFRGEEIEGAPKLAELIASKVEEQDVFSATLLLDNLKQMWRMDKKVKRQREESKLVRVTIAEAKRMQSGCVQVRGNIVGLSTAYQMLKSTRVSCDDCTYDHETVYSIPQFRAHVKERFKCPHYDGEHKGNDTVIAEYEYTPTVDIWLQDMDRSDDLTRLQVKLFENNTFDVNTGEIVDIVGHIYVIRNNDSALNKAESVLFAEELIYTKRKEIALTEQDKEEIQKWKSDLGKEGKSVINEAMHLFAPHVFGYNHIKKGILVQCANAGIKNDDKRLPIRMRVNILVIGDPGIAKGVLTDAALKIIPNCQSVNGIASSGISLVAVVNKDNNGSMSVNLGTLALAKNGIGRINEIGRLKLNQQPHLFDAMEEGITDMVKYGFPTNIECHTSVLATSNPISNRWKDEYKITMDEFPILLQVAQRFDLIFITRENKSDEFIDKYVDTRTAVAQNYEDGVYDKDLERLQKYVAYSRTFNPTIPEDIKLLLKYFLKQMAKSDVDGLFRKFDSLLRISIGIARLKLKSYVDAEDANEAMTMFQLMLSEFAKHVGIPRDPRDASYQEIRQVVKESYNIIPGGIEYREATKKACERNCQVNDYLSRGITDGKDPFSLRDNSKLKPVLELLRKDPNIIIIGEKPLVLKWNPDGSYNSDGKHPSDASDVCDANFPEPSKNNDLSNSDSKVTFVENSTIEKESDQKEASHTSYTSPSPNLGHIFRPKIGSDHWGCKDCNLRGDKWFMEEHKCRGVIRISRSKVGIHSYIS